MKRILAAAVVLLAAVALWSQQWARAQLDKSPRHGEWVTIPQAGRSLSAWVVYPESSAKRPVVLVIHEIFGMTDWAEEVTDEFAAAGYVAIAPDLLSGMGPGGGRTSAFPDQNAAVEAVGKLNPDQITADLNAAADYALKQPASNGELMVVGFCWGGGQSFRFATNRSDLKAAFVFYGTPPDKAAMVRVHAPVFGFYAGNDARVSATVPDTEAAMKALGKKYEPVIYDGAGHGFMRAGEDPAGTEANKKARDQSWERLKQLLKQSS